MFSSEHSEHPNLTFVTSQLKWLKAKVGLPLPWLTDRRIINSICYDWPVAKPFLQSTVNKAVTENPGNWGEAG